jgi:hypothetical protein
MFRVGLSLFLLLAAPLAACGGSNEAANERDDQRIEKCVALFTDQARRTSGEPQQELRTAIQKLCDDAARSDALLESGHLAADKEIDLLKRHTDFSIASALAGFTDVEELGITRGQLHTFGERLCQVATTGDYIRADGHLDTSKLLQENPELFSPFCVQGALSEYGSFSPEEKAALPRAGYKTLMTRACLEALREGVIDFTGPGGFQNPSIDQRAFNKIVARLADELRAAGELPNP